mgnify:CR=1 FL=1
MKKILIIIVTFIIVSINLSSQNQIGAFIEISGTIKITSPQGKDCTQDIYLPLIPNMIIEVLPKGKIILFFANNKKIKFEEGHKFKILGTITKYQIPVEPLNKITEKYIKYASINQIYTDEEISGTMSYQDNIEDITSDIIKQKIENIDKIIKDELLNDLIKGNLYRDNNFEQSAKKEFIKHKKLYKKIKDKK